MFPKYQDWELVFLPPIKSGHKTDLKGLLSNVFVGKFLEVFYFTIVYIVITESFLEESPRSFSSKKLWASSHWELST